MRPTLVLRIHPSPVLIPQMYMGVSLRHPGDAATHAYWDEARRVEYEGLWKKGEWKEVAEGGVKSDMVGFSLFLLSRPTYHYHSASHPPSQQKWTSQLVIPPPSTTVP